ncbi:hypothetical protein L210DRAFT_3589921 [Boletus edulis BED1]|uniref:Secreted protein n=1 Tax=Boletus edulis BED1 TaxID=1328754 RepID=A0AAD4B9E5_BOLED|nr:hypothetical protein L210DRAFT_3589921 [Boletus edulis BED1]
MAIGCGELGARRFMVCVFLLYLRRIEGLYSVSLSVVTSKLVSGRAPSQQLHEISIFSRPVNDGDCSLHCDRFYLLFSKCSILRTHLRLRSNIDIDTLQVTCQGC